VFPLRDNVPTRSFPVVTVGLIAANTAVWFWELKGTSLEYDVLHYGYYPCSVSGPCISPPVPHDHLGWLAGAFTSMFMHVSWLHIIGNMLFLWIFGNNVEDAMGRVRFLLWYLAAGLAATAVQTFVTLRFGADIEASVPNVGASGAIAGVLGAYIVLFPGARVLTIIGVFPVLIPAILFLGIWFLFQLWQGGYGLVHPEARGGVAFFAHVGGFVFGLLTVRLIARPTGAVHYR
jgi:membrane associated rhomboid family serine protease